MAQRKSLSQRLGSLFNIFRREEPNLYQRDETYSYGSKSPHKLPVSNVSSRTVLSAIQNRLANDVGMFTIKHVRVDPVSGNVVEIINNSGLSRCINLSANADQSGYDFIRDAIMSMLDEGVVALVPIDTDVDPHTGTFDVGTIRTGKIVGWFPDRISVSVYNEALNVGKYQTITVKKTDVAILENPLFPVMNEQGSLLKRLIAKLNMLDTVDDQAISGKLDLLMQFPFSIKTESREKQAKKRRDELEAQLTNSEIGVAYIDAVEKVIQLNRPVTNNVLAHVEYLSRQVYAQLGIPETIFSGTATPDEIQAYHLRSIKPILRVLCYELTRKFISPTAYAQGQRIQYFTDPFELVPPTLLSDFIDKSSRNEILTGNQIRSGLGYLPVNDPSADQLRNKNISAPTGLDSETTVKENKQSDNQQKTKQ